MALTVALLTRTTLEASLRVACASDAMIASRLVRSGASEVEYVYLEEQ